MSTMWEATSTTSHTRIGRRELIRSIAQRTNLSQKQAAKALETTLDTIREALVNGEVVRLVRFGTFTVKTTAPRNVINPRDRRKIEVPAKERVRFIPSDKLTKSLYRPVPGKPPKLPRPPRRSCRCPISGCKYSTYWYQRTAGDIPPTCPTHHVALICF